jgi:hypothetical protein
MTPLSESSYGERPLLLFDTSAVLARRTQEWQEFSQVGECFLPLVVLDELRFLCNRAPTVEQEQTAREFGRFYSESGWQQTAVQKSHPALKPASGQSVSKRARQALAVAQCAYGLSQERVGQLVVLVTNDQTLLERVQALGVPNLCGATAVALLQWGRTGRRPVAVTQALRAMETRASAMATPPRQLSATRTVTPSRTIPSRQARQNDTPGTGRAHKPISMRPSSASQLTSSIVALAGLAIAGFFIWGLLQPASFNQVWQQLGLPPLPRGQQK